MKIPQLLLSSMLILAIGQSQGAMVWQPLPKPKAPQAEHANHNNPTQPSGQASNRRRGAKPFRLQDGDGAQAQLWAPDLSPTAVVLNQGKTQLSSRGVDNYHALIALRETATQVDGALRYVYMHGKPSGESPSKLTHANKLALEITPQPLPREHWRYQSQASATFVIKWQGQPLANSPLQLQTSNGSQQQLQSNEYGFIHVLLPDDFAEIKPGRRHNPPAEFVLTATHQQDGKRYRTTLSAPYHVNPSHWQSNSLALWMLAAGFLGGLGLVRLIPRPAKRGKRR